MEIASAILLSVPAYICYITIAMYVLHRIAVAKQLDDEKWEGYIHQAILLANENGVKPHEPEWLQKATDAFETIYKQHNGVAPSAKDIADATTDLARVAGPYVLPILTSAASKALGGTGDGTKPGA